MKVFLIGYPGSGKSTYGKKVAKNLKLQFFDSDLIISEQKNMSISEIFKKHGEDYFRKCENEVLQEIINNNDEFLLATGGGLACSEENINIMLDNGIVFYLKSTPEILFNRIKNSKTIRPNHSDYENLFSKIKQEITDREKFYLKANFIIDAKRGCEKEITYFCTQNKD